MVNATFIRPTLSTLGTLAATGLGLYNGWLYSVRQRLAAHSHVLDTPFGPIEYAEVGRGQPILLAHGILGGWDQGMLLTKLSPASDHPEAEHPFRVISVSRWGYLRTPMPRNPAHRTHEAQADAYAALLDRLGIDRVAMVGVSGGTPSAIQFALRHPDRCWALVSIAGVTGRLDPRLSKRDRAFMKVLNSDWGLLGLRAFAKQRLLSFYGLTPERKVELQPQPEKLDVLESIYFPHPLAMRRKGFALDLEHFPNIPRYPVERIAVPTLAVHGTADATVAPSHSHFLVENVPGARLLSVEGAGHLAIVTHKETALAGVLEFLKASEPS